MMGIDNRNKIFLKFLQNIKNWGDRRVLALWRNKLALRRNLHALFQHSSIYSDHTDSAFQRI